MKTLAASQEAKRTASGRSAIWLVEIDLPLSGTQYYSTRAVTIDAQAYTPLVIGFAGLRLDMHSDVADPSMFVGNQCELVLTNITEDANRPETLMDGDRFDCADVRVYWIFETGSALTASEKNLLMTYRIDAVSYLNEKEMRLNLVDASVSLGERKIAYALTKANFPRGSFADSGALAPHIFGVVRGAELIPIDVGAVTALDGTLEETGTYIQVTHLGYDPLDEDYFAPTPGAPIVVQIDEERILVRQVDPVNMRMGSATDDNLIVRGYDGTLREQHRSGAQVRSIPADGFKWCVAAHACKSVSNVRVSEALLSPQPESDVIDVGGQALQIVTATALPSWRGLSESAEVLLLGQGENAALYWTPGGTAYNLNAVIESDIRDGARLYAPDYRLLQLTGSGSRNKDDLGPIVSADLCIEYEGHPLRIINTADPYTEPIWPYGHFEIKVKRQGGYLATWHLNPPRYADCLIETDAHGHAAIVQVHEPQEGGLGNSTQLFLRDGEGPTRQRSLDLIPRETNPYRRQYNYTSTETNWDGYNSAMTSWRADEPDYDDYDPDVAAWASAMRTWRGNQPQIASYQSSSVKQDYAIGRFSLNGSVGVNEGARMGWTYSQSSVLNTDLESGLWNVGVTVSEDRPNRTYNVPDAFEWRTFVEEGNIHEKIQGGVARLSFWVPNWNAQPAVFSVVLRQRSNTDNGIGFQPPLSILMPTDGSAGAVTFEMQLSQDDFRRILNIEQPTMGDLDDLDAIIYFQQGAEVSYTYASDGTDGHFYGGRSHVLFTSFRIEVSIVEDLDGRTNPLDAIVDPRAGLTGMTNSPRATQRINMMSLVDQIGWDFFDSDTTIEINAASEALGGAWVYSVYWEIERHPYVRSSGIQDMVADVQGYYRSSDEALVNNPADIVALLLTDETVDGSAVQDANFTGEAASVIDATTFGSARNNLSANGYALSRRVARENELRDLAFSAAVESRCRLWFEADAWKLAFLFPEFDSASADGDALSKTNCARFSRSMAGTNEIANRLILNARQSGDERGYEMAVQADSIPSQNEPWGLRVRSVDLNWHQNSDNGLIENLALVYLSRLRDRRIFIRAEGSMALCHLERGDIVTITSEQHRLSDAEAEIVAVEYPSLSQIAIEARLVSSATATYWSSGVCKIVVESGQAAIRVYYENILLARLDYQGNLYLAGEAIEPAS